MAAADDETDRAARRDRDALASARLPAGLEDAGRDVDLVHRRDLHPSGARADSRHSVPGTAIPARARGDEAAGDADRDEADTGGANPEGDQDQPAQP